MTSLHAAAPTRFYPPRSALTSSTVWAEVPAEQLRRTSLRIGVGIDLACVILMLLVGDFGSKLLASVMFLGLVATLRLITFQWKGPLLFLFFGCSLIFIEIPCALFGAASHLFPIDHGLAVELSPPSQSAVCVALAHLSLCYVAVVVACSSRRESVTVQMTRPRTMRLVSITALVIAISVTYDFLRESIPAITSSDVQLLVEALKFFSYDVAIATFWMAAFATWRSGNPFAFRRRAWIATTALVGFIAVYAATGSKGAILIGGLLVIVLTGGFGLALKPARLLIPRLPVVALAGILAVPLFGIVQSMREVRKYGPEFASSAAETGVSDQLMSGELVHLATIRLSIGYLRYLAIFSHFHDEPARDGDRYNRYLAYTARSFINLTLPGTPFPEEYAPSSALLEPLLARTDFRSLDRESYLGQLNSQPTTIFGFGFIVMGWLTPLALAVTTMALDRLTTIGRLWGPAAALPMAYFGLQCYGLDAAMHVSLSFTATFMLLAVVGKVRFRAQTSAPESPDVV